MIGQIEEENPVTGQCKTEALGAMISSVAHGILGAALTTKIKKEKQTNDAAVVALSKGGR